MGVLDRGNGLLVVDCVWLVRIFLGRGKGIGKMKRCVGGWRRCDDCEII